MHVRAGSSIHLAPLLSGIGLRVWGDFWLAGKVVRGQTTGTAMRLYLSHMWMSINFARVAEEKSWQRSAWKRNSDLHKSVEAVFLSGRLTMWGTLFLLCYIFL